MTDVSAAPTSTSVPGPGALPPASGAGSSPGMLGAAVEELLSGVGQPTQAQPQPPVSGTLSGGTLDGALTYLRSQGLPDTHPAIQEVLALKTAEGRWRAQQTQHTTASADDEGAWTMAWNAEVRATALSDDDPLARAMDLGLSADDARAFAAEAMQYRAARRPQGAQPQRQPGAAQVPLTVESLFDVATGSYRETMTPIWQAGAAMQAADARAAQAQAIIADSGATTDERARAQETLKEAMRDHRAAKMFETQALHASVMRLVQAAIGEALAPYAEFRDRVQPTFEEAERFAQAEAQRVEQLSRSANAISTTLTADGHSFYGPRGLNIYRGDASGQLELDGRGMPILTERGQQLYPAIQAWFKATQAPWNLDTFNMAISAALDQVATSDGGSVAPQPGAGQAGGVSLSQLAVQAGSAVASPGATQGGQQSAQPPY